MEVCWKFYGIIEFKIVSFGLMLSLSALHGVKSNCKYQELEVGQKFLCEIQALKQIDNNDCQCGWKKITRIVGGEETGINEYPMMCGLVDFKKEIIYCGCTIISNQYIITTAHCTDEINTNNNGVVVGEHDVTTGRDTNVTKLFRINKCLQHPGYNKNNAYNAHNDVAVCKIDGTIKYSAEIGPVCLPFLHKRDSFDGSIVTALGWGLLEYAGSKPTVLQKVNLNVINLRECKSRYHDISDDNLCTLTWGKDACQMDSGGPLLWQDPTTHNLVLVGIISAGVGCASTEPAVAMRTGAYMDWIVSVTAGISYCQVE